MTKIKIAYHQLMKKYHYYISKDMDAWDRHWIARRKLKGELK